MNNEALIAMMFIGATLSAIIANGKGRSPVGWLVIGGLFPMIALIAILCLPAVPAVPAAPAETAKT